MTHSPVTPSSAAHPKVTLSLALAVVAASNAPLVLLDGNMTVIAASGTFCSAFGLDPGDVEGREIFALGEGEWNVAQLRSLLTATVTGAAALDAYEMDLKTPRDGTRRLVLTARKLDYDDPANLRVVLSIIDVTQARLVEKLRDDLLQEKSILLREVQHRVANSLQIIASVLLQSARKVQSEETRSHLRDAHGRVMSIAAVQRQLAASSVDEVELGPYFTQLCQSLGASMIVDPDALRIEVESDASKVGADVSVSLGLVVTELVINALKHAFPGDREGTIKVGYRADGEDWTLSVDDDGVGMPVDAKDAKPGLGTSIVNAIARQLEATITVADGNPGTLVSVIHTEDPAEGEESEPAHEAV